MRSPRSRKNTSVTAGESDPACRQNSAGYVYHITRLASFSTAFQGAVVEVVISHAKIADPPVDT